MGGDLPILREDHYFLIGQRKLPFERLISGGDNRDIIPNNKFSEMFFDQDDLLVQRNKEGLFLYLVDFGAGE